MKAMSRMFRSSLLLTLSLGVAAPLLAQASHKLEQKDLSRYWILLSTQVQADAPNGGANLTKPSCAAVAYTIGSDGKPMNVQVKKMVPSGDLGRMASSIVANFRYGPSLTNRIGAPVDTYYIVSFNTPDDPTQKQQVSDACKLPGYGS